MTNREIANEILYRIGDRPIPFESVREIALQIYHELEGTEPDESFDDIYEILLSILPLTHRGANIDDNNVSTGTTWSSSKITSVLEDYVTLNDASAFLTANDVSNFVTNDAMDSSLSNYYTKDEVDASLDNKADKTELENYATLDDISTFLVPNDVSTFVTENDASVYATKTYVDNGLQLKQDTLAAGENIDIANDTISAKGYKFNGDTNGGFAEKYKQDAPDGGQVVANTATGLGSHAEGYGTSASGDYGCHAEGSFTQATGYITHAEGNLTKASETASHAEGGETEAKANYAHAEGFQTKALGNQSHTEGGYTKAQNYAEHAQGTANVSHKTAANAATAWQGDGNHTLHSIGNGRYTNSQSNAVEVMQNADVYIKGVGGYDGVHIKSEQGYETVKTLQQVISGKQDVLTAGQNIVITNNTISAVIDAGFHVEVVQTLPATGETNTIYFVPKAGGANPDVYDEYMYINNAWEKIGSTAVDLSNYYNKTEVDTLLSGKQATLTAGNNITINGTTISANDTTYSASDNIDITNNAIKAVGYRYNTTTGAFVEGDRDIDDSGSIRTTSSATGIMAHAEGTNGTASGRASHVEGSSNTASGTQSHAEGSNTQALGVNSHSGGRNTIANGYASYADGDGAETGGNYDSATSNPKTADSRTASAGDYAHAEGLATIAYGVASHAEGQKTFAKGSQSHAEGSNTNAIGRASHVEGTNNTASATNSHAEGNATTASGLQGHAEGYGTTASFNNTHAEGQSTQATNRAAHSEGMSSLASGYASHTEGYLTETGGDYTSNTKTAGTETDAGSYSHAEGNATIANGVASHSEGVKTLAKGTASHAEGYNNVVSANNAHAEGYNNVVAGNQSHVEGSNNTINSNAAQSHAEGARGVLSAQNSHTEGYYGITTSFAEHMQGTFNISHYSENVNYGSSGNTRHSIGIGTAVNARKNAVEVMQNGDAYLLGVGNYDGIHIKGETGAPSGLQTLQEAISGKQNALTAGDNIYIANNTISALGYEYDANYESIVTGFGGIAYGYCSHAEGQDCMIGYDATASHAEGVATETNNINEHAQGRYNVSHSVDVSSTQHEGNTVVSVGIGEDGERKNAFEIMQNGDIYVYGLGYYDGTATKYDDPDIMTLQDILKTIADAAGVDIGALF